MQRFIRLTATGVETVEADEPPADDSNGVWIAETVVSSGHLARCLVDEVLRTERTVLPRGLFRHDLSRRRTIAEFEVIR